MLRGESNWHCLKMKCSKYFQVKLIWIDSIQNCFQVVNKNRFVIVVYSMMSFESFWWLQQQNNNNDEKIMPKCKKTHTQTYTYQIILYSSHHKNGTTQFTSSPIHLSVQWFDLFTLIVMDLFEKISHWLSKSMSYLVFFTSFSLSLSLFNFVQFKLIFVGIRINLSAQLFHSRR